MIVPLGPGLVELSQLFTTLKMICNNSARMIFERIIMKLSWVCTDNSEKEKIIRLFLKGFFDMDSFWSFIELVTMLLLFFGFFFFFFFWPWDMWDLSFRTRVWTCTPCIGRWSPNHWTAREAPWPPFICLFSHFLGFAHAQNMWTLHIRSVDAPLMGIGRVG